MRVLGLDIGEKRIGVATADTVTRIATPLRVMEAKEVVENAPSWRRVLEDYEPEILVCGLPTTLQGAQGKQARRVKEVAQCIADASELPLKFVDERLSSSQAKRILREQGLSERDMRGKIDSVAASLFLETWLAAQDVGSQGER